MSKKEFPFGRLANRLLSVPRGVLRKNARRPGVKGKRGRGKRQVHARGRRAKKASWPADESEAVLKKTGVH